MSKQAGAGYDPDDDEDEPFNEMTSNAKVGRKSITAVVDDDDAEILGFAMMATTGDWLYTPRDGLQDKFQQHDVTRALLPREVRPWMAYGRMTNELVYSENEDTVTNVTGFDAPLDVTFELKSGSEKYHHLYASVFYPEDVIGKEGGDHHTNKILTINYLPEREAITTDPHIDEDSPLWDHCTRFMSRAQQLFKRHQECHNGNDMRNVINDFLFQGANTVRFRNGCYFVGAHHQGTVEGLAEVWEWMNQFKERGQRCEIMTIPVVDSEKQRQQVERLAREKTEAMVDEAIEEALDGLTDESNAEQLAKSIMDEVSEAESFAEEYNMLLEAEMSVKRVLEDRRENLEDEKEEIVNEVLDRLE